MDPIGKENVRVTGKKKPTKSLDWIAILEQVPIQLLYSFVATRGWTWTTTQLDGDYNGPLQGSRKMHQSGFNAVSHISFQSKMVLKTTA